MKTFFEITGSNGKKLHAKKWLPGEKPPKAVVQIVHGLAEHSERYNHFANFLTKHGYAVFAFDLRGHGQTDPDEPGFIADDDGFDLLVKDLSESEKYVKQLFPDIPWILFAHSMGSFIAQRYMQLYDHYPSGIIYSGSTGKPPMTLFAGIPIAVRLKKRYGPREKSKLLFDLSFGSYNKKFKPNRTQADWLSRDDEMVDLYLDDPLCGFICSNSFYHQLFTGLKELHSHTPFADHDKHIPILLISGDQDPVSDMGKGISNLEKLIRKSGVKNLQTHLYPGGRHEMLNEINRNEVMNNLLEWIEKEIPGIQ